jgi:hypothetical protein
VPCAFAPPSTAGAAKPEGRLKLGSLLTSIAQEAGGLSDAEAEPFVLLRDKMSASPLRFE